MCFKMTFDLSCIFRRKTYPNFNICMGPVSKRDLDNMKVLLFNISLDVALSTSIGIVYDKIDLLRTESKLVVHKLFS